MKNVILVICVVGIFIGSQLSHAQKMTVKDDGGNVLMEVNDEGTVGSITLPSGAAPTVTTNKLYNVGGVLYWNGNAVPDGHSLDAADGSPTDALYVDNDGDVGIGIPNPIRKLQIDYGNQHGYLRLDRDDTSTETLLTFATGGTEKWYLGTRAAAPNTGFHIYSSDAGADVMTIKNTGEVGLGTPSPDYPLHVWGGAVTDVAHFRGTGNPVILQLNNDGTAANNVSLHRLDVTLDGTDTWNRGELVYRRTGTDEGRIEISTQGTSKAITILNNGDTGIGVEDPDVKLEVNGQVKITGGSPDTDKVLTSDANGLATWQPLAGGALGWGLSGNAGTTPGTHFLGTTDNQALEFKVNSQRAMRFAPTSSTPNIIGGHSSNTVTAGVIGATIAGGGANKVTDHNGTVGGGGINQAGDDALDETSAEGATVSGGLNNTASGGVSVVGGGSNNTAGGGATVSGGIDNTATGTCSAIPGGYENNASGQYSFAAGYRAKANNDGTFVWADYSVADFASVSDKTFIVRATNGVGINTNNPGFSLDVGGSNNATNLHVTGLVSGAAHGQTDKFVLASGTSLWFYDSNNTISRNGNRLDIHGTGGVRFTGGYIGINAATAYSDLDIEGASGYSQFRLRTSYTPTGSADTNGNTGDVAWDDNYVYMKTSTGWKRAALSAW